MSVDTGSSTTLAGDPPAATKGLEKAQRVRISPIALRGLQLSIFSFVGGAPVLPGFTVANILQVISVLMMMSAFGLMGRRMQGTWLLIVVGLTVSLIPLVALTDESPEWIQFPYFVLAATYVFQALALAPHVDLKRTLRGPINLSACILILLALSERAADAPLLTLYFDDKSHAVVAILSLAFLVLWVNESYWAILLAIALATISAATASRIVVAGLPFLLLALALTYAQSRKKALTAFAVYAHHLVLLILPLLTWLALNSTWVSSLNNRLSEQNATAAASTQGHLELALLALHLKIAHPLTLLLGVGPGGFPAGVRGLGIDATAFGQVDPSGYYSMMNASSFVPVHSASLTILVEYPVWVSLIFFGSLVASWIRLIQARDFVLASYSIGFFTMTSLYSSHNEFFFWVAFAVPLLIAAQHSGSDKIPSSKRGGWRDAK